MKYGVRIYGEEGLEYLSYANNGKLTTYRDTRKIALFDEEWEAHLQTRNYLQKIRKKTYFYEIGTMTNEEEETTQNNSFY